jgi:hypothetical protein
MIWAWSFFFGKIVAIDPLSRRSAGIKVQKSGGATSEKKILEEIGHTIERAFVGA